MHQRITMHHFEAAPARRTPFVFDPEEPRRLDQQKRPQPLAAGQARIAHGADESRRTESLTRAEPCWTRVGPASARWHRQLRQSRLKFLCHRFRHIAPGNPLPAVIWPIRNRALQNEDVLIEILFFMADLRLARSREIGQGSRMARNFWHLAGSGAVVRWGTRLFCCSFGLCRAHHPLSVCQPGFDPDAGADAAPREGRAEIGASRRHIPQLCARP